MRLRHEEMGRQHFLDNGAHAWQGERGLPTSSSFVLEKAVRECGQDNVALPAGQRPAFEVVEANLVLEFLILLLDGPSLMGEPHQRA